MEAKSESKYERLRKIGIGSYGVVYKCVNRQTRQIVAIKRYSENDSDPIIRKIAMREVRMLRQLKHPNLINLIEVFRRKRRLHLVFDYCELTVLDVIEKYANNCPLNLIKKIIWQTVNGINYCHTHNCIHRDIKPENILINQAGVVKLCDFGFARSMSGLRSNQLQMSMTGKPADSGVKRESQQALELASNKENLDRQALTEYVATRWYRAPELLIGDTHYGIKIDIWAIGCVTAELMRGEPMWPGKTDYDQLSMIMSSLGQLTTSQMYTLLKQNLYDQAATERLLNQTPNLNDSVEKKLPTYRVGSEGIDFVIACVQMDPAKRPTSEELLKHDYIHSVRMAQFVKGASHAIAINSANSTASQSHQSGASSIGLSDRLKTTMTPPARSNSQSLMLATGSKTNNLGSLTSSVKHNSQSPSLSGIRPAKRLVVAVKSGSDQSSRTSSIPVVATDSTPSASSGNSNSLKEQAPAQYYAREDPNIRYKRKQPAVQREQEISNNSKTSLANSQKALVAAGSRRRPAGFKGSSPNLGTPEQTKSTVKNSTPRRDSTNVKSKETPVKAVRLSKVSQPNDAIVTQDRSSRKVDTKTRRIRQLTTTIEGNQTQNFNSELGYSTSRQVGAKSKDQNATNSSASSSQKSGSGQLYSNRSISLSYLPSVGLNPQTGRSSRVTNKKSDSNGKAKISEAGKSEK